MNKIAIMIFVSLLFCSCKDTGKVDPGLELTDDLGITFKIDKKPSKVISLAPSITEIIYYIGADAVLSGVTKYCDYPPEASGKTIIGGLLDPNLELISQIKPDIIFLTTEGNSRMTYKSLTDIGYKVFVLNPRNIEGIISTMEKLNKILKPKDGDSKIAGFKSELGNIVTDMNIKFTFAAFLSVKPLITFNDNTFMGDIFRKCGYINLFGKEELDYPGIYEEDILIKNPDYLFVITDTSITSRKKLMGEIGNRFDNLKSVKEKKFFFIDENVFSRPGPRVINALRKLKEIRSINN